MTVRAKTIGVVAAGLGLVVTSAAGLIPAWRPRGPRANVETPVFDVGDVDARAAVECQFRIRNTGWADLELTDIKTDCACSGTEVDRRRILGGESATVRVTLHTPDRGGPVQGSIIVKTNDPCHPILPLRIVGRVRPTLQIVPSAVYLCFIGRPDWQAARVRHAALCAWSDKQVSIEKVTSLADWLTASFEPQARGHRVLGRVQIRLNDLPPRGDERAEVTIVGRAGRETTQRTLTVLVDPP